MKRKKNHENSAFLRNNHKLISEYESLRLFALDNEQYQQGYNWFVQKGMIHWMSNKSKEIEKKKTDNPFQNEFENGCDSEIVQTITNILTKKLRVTDHDESSESSKESPTAQCLFVR